MRTLRIENMAKIAINAVKSLKFETLDRKSLSPKTIVVTELRRLQRGSGRNLHPIWLKGEFSLPATYLLCVIVQVLDARTT